jgi:iduronate 2-sulfatase
MMKSNDGMEGRLNVLFLCVDDLRPGSIGVYGDSSAITPNIDLLAQRGLLFERAYCQQALCAPSRASLMTGRRPDAFPKIRSGSQSAHYREFCPGLITLPQAFKNNGYHTESIGKVNHVYPPLIDPPSWSLPERLADITKRDEYLAPENRVRGFLMPMAKGAASENVPAPDSAYPDGQVADAGVEALHRLKDEVFFLAVGFKRPHLPWSVPDMYWEIHDRRKFSEMGKSVLPEEDVRRFPWRYEWKSGSGEMRAYTDIPDCGPLESSKAQELVHGYYSSVTYIDAQIGRLVRELEQLNLTSRTIIVVLADHGYHLGENGQWGKKTNTELDTRVPLIVIAPGYTKEGTRTSALVELVDIYPTLAEIGGNLECDKDIDGRSFAEILASPDREWKEAVFSVYERDGIIGRSVRSRRYRYTEWRNIVTEEMVDCELYNSEEDPLERNNLSGNSNMDEVKQNHITLLERNRGNVAPGG